jgi:hypothetical protein
VKSPEEALIKEVDEFVKYALIDQGNELRYYLLLLLWSLLNSSFSS